MPSLHVWPKLTPQEEKEAREAEEAAKREAKEAEEAAKAEAAAAEPATDSADAVAEKPAAEEDDARMTKEQLSELAEALNILTAKSSIVKERRELQTLLEDNLLSEAVRLVAGCRRDDTLQMQESKERPDETDQKTVAVSKRVRSMIKKIDSQLEKYDEKVGSSLNIIHTNAKGQISLKDLETAFRAIKHAPDEEMVEKLGEKLDVDKDGFVVSLSLLCKGYD